MSNISEKGIGAEIQIDEEFGTAVEEPEEVG